MLRYDERGDGPALIALHGNFASRAWWADLLGRVPARVVAPDLPGFGDSPLVGEPSVEACADAVLALADALDLNDAVLLGHSFGGAVALELAARHPQRWSGLVLAASAPLSGLRTPEENYPVLELMREQQLLREASLGALFPSGRPVNFATLVTDAGRMHPACYSGNARSLSRWSVAGRVPNLPTLVLGGELDALVTPEMTVALARELGTSPIIVAGRGHGFPQEDPVGFAARVATFLETLHVPAQA